MTNPYTGQPSGPMPQQPYGQQPPPYPQPAPYPSPHQAGPAPYGQVPHGKPPAENYAHWGMRAVGGLLDYVVPGIILYFLLMLAVVIGGIVQVSAPRSSGGAIVGMVLWVLISLAYAAFFIWNSLYRRGKTGQSLGQRAAGIKTVSEATGQPLGFGHALLRNLCHFPDSFILYLSPLWDAKRQTLADKIVGSVVLPAPATHVTAGGVAPQPAMQAAPQPAYPVPQQQPYPQSGPLPQQPTPPPQQQSVDQQHTTQQSEESTQRFAPPQQPPQQ